MEKIEKTEGFKLAVKHLVENCLPTDVMKSGLANKAVPWSKYLGGGRARTLLMHCEGVFEHLKDIPQELKRRYLVMHLNYIFSRISPYEMEISEFETSNMILQELQSIHIDTSIAIAVSKNYRILEIIFRLEKMIRRIDGRV